MGELKTGLNADKFATWMFPESFYHSFFLANVPYTFSKPLEASRLARFRKT